MNRLLASRAVERPWGRDHLPAPFVAPAGTRIGEIWFETPPELEALLVKYIFTSEALSVQVHPSDTDAPGGRGKEECWLVTSVEPGARLGIGFVQPIGAEAMRAAALDGSIEHLLEWHPVAPGDFFYIPAGTVHAIGAGIGLIEVQQNCDITYRLYDYGRPRELHLDAGIAVSDPVPWVVPFVPVEAGQGRVIAADGPAFVLEHWTCSGNGRMKSDGRPIWLVPTKGEGRIDGARFAPGGVWIVEDEAGLELGPGSDMLVAYPGQGVIAAIWQ